MVEVLITGGAGYLGSTLSEELLNRGYKVTALDNLMYKQTSQFKIVSFNKSKSVTSNKNFNFVQQDVTDLDLLKETILNYDVIIPLAAIVGAPACDADKDLATRVNFEQMELMELKTNTNYTM